MEMEDFGFPPVFPEDVEVSQTSSSDSDPVVKDKAKGKKVGTDLKIITFCGNCLWKLIKSDDTVDHGIHHDEFLANHKVNKISEKNRPL